ncbi:MAG TPA: aminotransferase class V-fold PLP-dependent enzyme [Gemmatimonadaceae bacterium]|nr:aminotransferase class V-fold PLP-dependent enzyme [Gemmatimonadaceae bacterium]
MSERHTTDPTGRGDPLLGFRDEFPILAHTNYLVSNSLGAMPRSVPDRMAEYTDAWAQHGVRAWARGWWEMPGTVGDVIAPLLGAGPGEVVMLPNVTMAQAAVLSALDYRPPRNRIVMTALDFPSVRYVYDGLARRLGAEIVVVESDDGIGIDEARLEAAIDERTALVAISHVLFRSAWIVDVERISRHAHAAGALVSLDAFHSVGVMPVDVKGIGADFLTGGVLKWLCGGPGGCFLWVAPEVTERYTPALTGWQAHARPFAFEPEIEYATNAFRWLNGTPPIPALYAALEGPQIIRRAGISAVREKSVRQTTRLVALADTHGYPVHAPRDPARRGGTVAFDVPHGYEVAQYLLANKILVDYRPGAGIRVAPHFYTRDDELEVAVAAIAHALASGEWASHAARTSVVT